MSILNNSENHTFKPSNSSDSRSPCPALNALANHGYIPHNGKDFTFVQLINAMVLVYNISYPLAFLLATVGFVTSGKLSFHSHHDLPSEPRSQDSEVKGSWIIDIYSRFINCARSLALATPSMTLDLQSLSERGYFKIAHDGSLVHPNGEPSTCPDPTEGHDLLERASTAHDSNGLKGGLDFRDIVKIHTEKALSARPMLNEFHNQVALGECGLLWEVMKIHTDTLEGVIPTCRLRQWLVEEKLPDGWWDNRPKKTVGLLLARRTANEVARLSKEFAEQAGIRKVTIHDAISVD